MHSTDKRVTTFAVTVTEYPSEGRRELAVSHTGHVETFGGPTTGEGVVCWRAQSLGLRLLSLFVPEPGDTGFRDANKSGSSPQ